MPPEAVDLVSRLLQYSPNLRCNAVCFLFWLFFSAFLISLDATFSAWTMWKALLLLLGNCSDLIELGNNIRE
jgi:hypothetical protein